MAEFLFGSYMYTNKYKVRIFDQTRRLMHAVITSDIVNSTLLDPEQEEQLMDRLAAILKPYKYEFYRGDSFHIYLSDPRKALEVALQCRTAAISLAKEESNIVPDIRVAIGVGNVEQPVNTLALAKGEAFLLSGRALDELEKAEGRLIIVTKGELANIAFSILSDYINSIYRHMTPKQAEVIFELLRGETQQDVADKLKRSKSTISQHVAAGRWNEIENVLKKYSGIIEQASL